MILLYNLVFKNTQKQERILKIYELTSLQERMAFFECGLSCVTPRVWKAETDVEKPESQDFHHMIGTTV